MVSTAQRPRMLAALLVALLAIGSEAMARPILGFNGHYSEELTRTAIFVRGTAMVSARTLFSYFGSVLERRGEWYDARVNQHLFRFRPGTRLWYLDEKPFYFSEAATELNGVLFVSVLELVSALGGRYDWDEDSQAGNIWFSQLPAGYGPAYGPSFGPGYIFQPSPPRLEVQFPPNFTHVSSRGFTLSGEATPYSDLRIVVYRSPPQGDVQLFDTLARVAPSGDWSLQLPLFGQGTYRIYVQLLDQYGHVVTTRRMTLYAE